MIKVTVKDAVIATPALERIGQTRLPAKAAWRVSRLLSKLQNETRDYTKHRNDKFKELGETPDGGNTYNVPQDPAKRKKLEEDLEAILSEPVQIDYDPIPLSLFGEAALAPTDLALVEQFIEEPKE